MISNVRPTKAKKVAALAKWELGSVTMDEINWACTPAMNDAYSSVKISRTRHVFMRSYHNHENVDCLNSALAFINHPLNLAQPFIKADEKIFRIHTSTEKSEMKLEDPGSVRKFLACQKIRMSPPDSVSTHSESSTLLFSKCTAHCTILFLLGTLLKESHKIPLQCAGDWET